MGKTAAAAAPAAKRAKADKGADASSRSIAKAPAEEAPVEPTLVKAGRAPAKAQGAIAVSTSNTKAPGVAPVADSDVSSSHSYVEGSLEKFIRGAKTLGAAVPIERSAEEDAAAALLDDSDADSDLSEEEEDERLLTLRVLQADSRGEYDCDWIGSYEPDSDYESDDDMGGEGEGEEEAPNHSAGKKGPKPTTPANSAAPAKQGKQQKQKGSGATADATVAVSPAGPAPAAASQPKGKDATKANTKANAKPSAPAPKAGKATTVPAAVTVAVAPATKAASGGKGASKTPGPTSTAPVAAVGGGGEGAPKKVVFATSLVAGPSTQLSVMPTAVLTIPEDKATLAAVSGAKRSRSEMERERAAAPAVALPPPVKAGAGVPVEPKVKRPLPKAFVPGDASRCVWVGNLPQTATDDSVKALLKQFGKVKTVHFEVNNNGKPAGFGYVEFDNSGAAASAVKVAPELEGRPLRLSVYTSATNYRTPDGKRQRTKKDKAEARRQERGEVGEDSMAAVEHTGGRAQASSYGHSRGGYGGASKGKW